MSQAAVACDLCGLDAGPQPIEQSGKRFCCAGCSNVYAILAESGVLASGIDVRQTDLFRRSLQQGLISNRDSAAKSNAVPPGTPEEEKLFHLSGLWCSSCAWLIEHALNKERGVQSAEVMFFSDSLKVRYYPQYLPTSRILERVESLGYRATDHEEAPAAATERRDLFLRMGVAAFLWMNVMFLNLAIFVGAFQSLPEAVHRVLPFVVAAATLPVIFYSAAPILRAAWNGLRAGILRMESLLALGILAAFSYSTVEGIRGGTHIYFDIVCAITTLVLLGKWIELGAKERAAQTITGLHRMLPRKARLLLDGAERFVSMERLQAGDTFLVKAGERIPADGEVSDGESEADESLLTGESKPVRKSPGKPVVAGSLNLSSPLTVKATSVGAGSTIAQIVAAVENALRSRSLTERRVDQISRTFVPVVMLLALATFAGWSLSGAPLNEALMRGITVLVIACPCALGIATPLALNAAVSAAAKRGLLVRDVQSLESFQHCDTVVLDKTGTVTETSFSVRHIDAAHLPVLAALEAHSEHPLGQSLVECARHFDTKPRSARNVQVMKGLGIRGTVDGIDVQIGSRRLFTEIPQVIEAEAADWESQAATVAFYSFDNAVTGCIAFGNRVRPEAIALTQKLKARNVRVLLVSGDSQKTTEAVAAEIGADSFLAGTPPEEKAAVIRQLQGLGHKVAMVGDGINDAPALAQADLGVAMGSGTDLAMRAAAVVLIGGKLENVVPAFDLSRTTVRVVRQNLFWAFFYNVAGIGFAAAGILNPIVAAAAMVVSSLTVVGNSYRLAK